jgi:multidrug efflux pump subunit AcrA (membrane-fusion protein)
LTLTLFFSYAYEGEIRPGMSAQVSIPSMMTSVTGSVREVNYVNRVTPHGARLFMVVIELTNPGTLTAGIAASASIRTPGGEQILPYEADTLQYNRTVNITSRAAGDVIRADMLEFMRVSAGQVLMTLSEDTSERQLQALRQELDAARGAYEAAQAGLDRFYAVAPISGTIMSFPLSVGQVVEAETASGRPSIMIQDINTMFIEISIDEINIANVRPGMWADLNNFMGTEFFSGVIESVSLQGENTQGITRYPAIIRVDNSDGRIMPFMSMEFSIVAAQSDDCLVIPLSAVKYTMAGTCVFVRSDARPGNAIDAEEFMIDVPEGFYAIPVVIGLSDNRQAEIISGLEEGMEVFTQFGASNDMWGGFGGRGGVVRVG